MISIVIVTLGVLLAAAFDWKARKIPNALTFSMIGTGLAIGFLMADYPALVKTRWAFSAEYCFFILIMLETNSK